MSPGQAAESWRRNFWDGVAIGRLKEAARARRVTAKIFMAID
jgi:hypothetical protein